MDVVASGAGVEHRRIYDLRHTYATWSPVAGVDIFTLARRMGTSMKVIDRTYGHLVAGADAYEREPRDAFDEQQREGVGRAGRARCGVTGALGTRKPGIPGLL